MKPRFGYCARAVTFTDPDMGYAMACSSWSSCPSILKLSGKSRVFPVMTVYSGSGGSGKQGFARKALQQHRRSGAADARHATMFLSRRVPAVTAEL